MPRELLPPEGFYRVSVTVMQAPQLPRPIRQTYAILRVFAWNGYETPDLPWGQVTQSTGLDRQSVYRHLLTLVNTGVTRWRTASVGHIRLTFTDGVGGAENCLNFETSQKRDGAGQPSNPNNTDANAPVLPEQSVNRLKIETSQNCEMPLSLTPVNTRTKERRRLKNETSQKRDKSEKVDLHPLAEAIASVCRMELAANRARIFSEAKLLLKAKPTPTPELVRQHYGERGSFWRAADWRGKKGEDPTPALIRETWGKWGSPPATRSNFKDYN